ncbi:zf-DHHC-domain-containing protein [Paxillus ammoniavirescens]|nr:zf-DHHC-domain-containing protein [Paxillus ammoniavirescens]
MPQSDHVCCGVIEEAQDQARRRRANKPQPWIILKFTVGLTILIAGYTTYVYAGRFCRDMIMKDNSALGSQATGVAFLVVFCFLLLLVLWSYAAVITTGPGNARNYTQTTMKPGHDRLLRDSSDMGGTAYELVSPTIDLFRPPTHGPNQDHDPQLSLASKNSKSIVSQASAAASSLAKPEISQADIRGPDEAHVTDVLAAPDAPHIQDTAAVPTRTDPGESRVDLPSSMFSRRPPTTPVLLPEYRYCSKCKIVKPPRAHHCRACGTCILKYDHHCPCWCILLVEFHHLIYPSAVGIGHCVGAFNHKFFVNFLQWGTIFCLWTFATLLCLNIMSPSGSSVSKLDPQQIVVIALSGFFGIFAILMLITQLHLILMNQTTVESLNLRLMRDREQEILSHRYRWYEIGAKRRARQQWDSEWGEIGKEGNLWWLGSSKANWEAVMGRNVWWWLLPVGHHLDDGLSYPTNPRFDSVGRWRRKKEWPSDLR